MASNILAAVRQIKSNVAEHLEAAAIERLCHELKHVWGSGCWVSATASPCAL